MLLIRFLVVLILLLSAAAAAAAADESFSVLVPPDPISVGTGSSVTLPCWVFPPRNAESMRVHWFQRTPSDQMTVLHYQEGQVQSFQAPQFSGRAFLRSGGLKGGDVSLRLENVSVEDGGEFQCFVSGDQHDDWAGVFLNVTVGTGSSVTLPCWVFPPRNAESMRVHWFQRTPSDQISVLHYQEGQVQSFQAPQFSGRAFLRSGGLKGGDVSLRLENVSVEDGGEFQCFVSGDRHNDWAGVFLNVTGEYGSVYLSPLCQ
ncbi:butyrophilin subfamily 1 member A1-like [Conger conger]|uniref:butyrophilin subfamily 1 member A1-like n=1 Tax=Conger conger TaxID=82655 RepID=UPI002A5ADDE1|nr:butyrophilin subfamily 1 member A1-like [Conger conger]